MKTIIIITTILLLTYPAYLIYKWVKDFYKQLTNWDDLFKDWDEKF